MSVVLEVALAAGGLALGRWLGRTLYRRSTSEAEAESAGQVAPPVTEEEDPRVAFPCALGDVVVRTAERDEAWLAGAIVFSEERPVAVLFVAPEAGGDRALFVREGDDSIVWLASASPERLGLTADPPHVVEHEGVRFERRRRLPLRAKREGSSAPDVGDHAVVAEYQGAGSERLLVVAGKEQTLAFAGVLVPPGAYDVLPGGKATL